MLELKDHVDLASGRIGVQPRLIDGDPRGFADFEKLEAIDAECLIVHLMKELVDSRAVEEMRPAITQSPVLNVAVGKRCVLGEHVDGVHPESIDAAREPPAHHPVDRSPDLLVLPVQIRLPAREQMQVILTRSWIKLPNG